MLSIKIICVGKIKEKSLNELCDEYIKRLSKYVKLEIIEVADEKLPLKLNESEVNKIKQIESSKIKGKLDKLDKRKVFFLDLSGKEYSSEEFADSIEKIATYGNSEIIFVIGGSLGMSEELLGLSSNKICFSKMTFPHQLIRLFLLEQLFRAFKIINNETYHH